MPKKKTPDRIDQAIAIAFAEVNKDSPISAMDLFVVGTGFAGADLSLVYTTWMPGVCKALGAVLIVTGLVAMIMIAREI